MLLQTLKELHIINTKLIHTITIKDDLTTYARLGLILSFFTLLVKFINCNNKARKNNFIQSVVLTTAPADNSFMEV